MTLYAGPSRDSGPDPCSTITAGNLPSSDGLTSVPDISKLPPRKVMSSVGDQNTRYRVKLKMTSAASNANDHANSEASFFI